MIQSSSQGTGANTMSDDDKEDAGSMQTEVGLSDDKLMQRLLTSAKSCRQQAVAARLPVVMDLVLELRAKDYSHRQIQAILTEAGWHLPFNTYISTFRRIMKARKGADIDAVQMQTMPDEVERCPHCGEILTGGSVKPSGVDESSQARNGPPSVEQRRASFAALFLPREPGKSRWS